MITCCKSYSTTAFHHSRAQVLFLNRYQVQILHPVFHTSSSDSLPHQCLVPTSNPFISTTRSIVWLVHDYSVHPSTLFFARAPRQFSRQLAGKTQSRSRKRPSLLDSSSKEPQHVTKVIDLHSPALRDTESDQISPSYAQDQPVQTVRYSYPPS